MTIAVKHNGDVRSIFELLERTWSSSTNRTNLGVVGSIGAIGVIGSIECKL